MKQWLVGLFGALIMGSCNCTAALGPVPPPEPKPKSVETVKRITIAPPLQPPVERLECEGPEIRYESAMLVPTVGMIYTMGPKNAFKQLEALVNGMGLMPTCCATAQALEMIRRNSQKLDGGGEASIQRGVQFLLQRCFAPSAGTPG